MPVFAGIELGGTKCVCTLAHGPGAIVEQRTIPTQQPEPTLGAIDGILDRWAHDHPFAAIGIGSFGPVDLDPDSANYGYVLATNKGGWTMTDVARRLSSRHPVPMAFDTDVNGAALAEMAWGAGKGLSDFAYVTVGTGVGVGLIVRGQPTRGVGHSELGHILVPRLDGDDGPSACRFHRDCVEGLASGPAIEAVLGETPVSDIAADHPVWTRVADAVAKLCHSLICTTGPQRIAVGGGVFMKQDHLLPRIEPMLRASLNGYLSLPANGPYIVPPSLGAQAGPLGSIALARAALAVEPGH
ncbi:Fructokinase [Sphingomonas sp. EC-HK361]|uniref:ROK family protein n=1 Tax=Sphingomonas sp. EC-HK361 TaxID=2038397 RepID=UPI0012549E5C|nr:ROK family protein [Sphingomonas sp. EC-HK361]VVT22000.1 Fructokinase [Sphingomonas sp. EC-HK361]